MGKSAFTSGNQSEAPLAIRTEEGKITRHLILSTTAAGPRSLDLLHRDLFDSRPKVVISAIGAVGRRREPRSVTYLLPLLDSENKTIQLEAIRALGRSQTPAAAKALTELNRRSRDDEVRCATFTALAETNPTDAHLAEALREQASSADASPLLRGCAAALLMALVDPSIAHQLFPKLPSESVEILLEKARENTQLRSAVIRFGGAWLDRWTSLNRRRLVTIAGESNERESLEIILHAIEDTDPEVRFSGYRALAVNQGDASRVEEIVGHLLGRWEPYYSLEEEALNAIDRLEHGCSRRNLAFSVSTLIRLRNDSEELFRGLTEPSSRQRSASGETNTLILRSREYMEYYVSEDFRRALMNYIEGASPHSAEDLLSMLKRTAERIEDRHFDGYRALAEIIRNPPDARTVVRELSNVELGRRVLFGRLIRTLRLMRLSSQADRQTLDLLAEILAWSRHERLFRLAEAALNTLAKFLPERAIEISRELLAAPFESKILAIAAIRLMAELGDGENVDTVLALFGATTDSHVLLNLFDALSAVKWAADRRIFEAAVRILVSEEDSEVVREATRFLSRHRILALSDITESDFDHFEEWRQLIVLEMFDRIVETDPDRTLRSIGNLLQHILRNRAGVLQGVAAVLLLKLGDPSASKALIELLEEVDDDLRVEIVRRLAGHLTPPLTLALLSLLNQEHAGLQQVLREALIGEKDPKVLELVLQRIAGRVEDQESAETASTPEVPKEERAADSGPDVVEELALFAVNIQRYSSAAERLSADQLTGLVRDYEEILLPMIDSHRGKLIKRTGGSHLFTFSSALDAALAGLRLQKALKRFNSYREEPIRVLVRIGIHWGQFARRAGDVLGANVEITDRLESLAKSGSILVSEPFYERLDGRIHARELGKINLKERSGSLKVFEPFEIQVDLPEDLDPLKKNGRTIRTEGTSQGSLPSQGNKAALEEFSAQVLEQLSELFGSLDELCHRVENREAPVSLLRAELRKGWGRAQELFRSPRH